MEFGEVPVSVRVPPLKVSATVPLPLPMAPLKLPHRLTVQTGECGATYVPYAYGPVTICYEYLDQIESAVEAAWALDLSVLPAAVMRAYLPKPATDA